MVMAMSWLKQTSWLTQMLRLRQEPRRKARSAQNQHRRKRVAPVVEALDNRLMLSVTAMLAGGTLFVTGDEQTLSGWLLPTEDRQRAVVLLHGFGGNRKQMVPRARFLREQGYTVLLYDARAWEREGHPRFFSPSSPGPSLRVIRKPGPVNRGRGLRHPPR